VYTGILDQAMALEREGGKMWQVVSSVYVGLGRGGCGSY
jgi:hypothetical protein